MLPKQISVTIPRDVREATFETRMPEHERKLRSTKQVER